MDLRKFQLFENLPENELKIANALLRVKDFGRREIVCRKEESADGLYLLLSGQLQAIDIAEDGREIGLNIIKAGAFFGDLWSISTETRTFPHLFATIYTYGNDRHSAVKTDVFVILGNSRRLVKITIKNLLSQTINK